MTAAFLLCAVVLAADNPAPVQAKVLDGSGRNAQIDEASRIIDHLAREPRSHRSPHPGRRRQDSAQGWVLRGSAAWQAV